MAVSPHISSFLPAGSEPQSLHRTLQSSLTRFSSFTCSFGTFPPFRTLADLPPFAACALSLPSYHPSTLSPCHRFSDIFDPVRRVGSCRSPKLVIPLPGSLSLARARAALDPTTASTSLPTCPSVFSCLIFRGSPWVLSPFYPLPSSCFPPTRFIF